MKRPYLICCLAVTFGAVGCVGPSRITETPTTLDQVNSALEGHTASIVMLNGRQHGNLRMVLVETDTTFYRSYQSPHATERVPTAEIAQIRFRTDSGARDGFLIGGLPGLALGIAGLVAHEDNADGGGGVIGYAAVVGGAVLALAGGLVGVIVGNNVGKHEVIAYEHPVGSYLDDDTER